MKLQRHSFTLLELLTVIAIIAILAGLLLPAVNRARVSAKTAACLSNQKQTGMLITQYRNESDQRFVSANKPSGSKDAYIWSIALFNKKLVTDPKGMRCPSMNYTANELDSVANIEAALKQTYGVIYADSAADYCFDFRGTKSRYDSSAKIEVADSMLVLAGCTVTQNRVPHYALDLSSSSLANGQAYKIHGNFCNFLFMDGHAESLQNAELAGKKFYSKQNADGAEKVPTAYQFATE